jgi:polysaccharide biosynthesis/export protein
VSIAALVSGCGASLGNVSSPVDASPSQFVGIANTGTGANTGTVATVTDGAPADKAVKSVANEFVAKATPGTNAYRIGPQDVIEISVFKVAELNKTVQVADNGSINVPLLGEVTAGGITARELEVNLAKRLGDKYLRDPQVSVFVKEYNSQRVTVEGAVKKPGVFPLKGELSLLQAIAGAQGLEEVADSEVLVFRDVAGQRQTARFNLTEIRSGAAKDPTLAANDVVVVGSSTSKELLNNFAKIVPVARMFTVF